MRKLLLMLLTGILLISCVQAWDFDNVKSVDYTKMSKGYPEITVKDSIFWVIPLDPILKTKITTHTADCITQCNSIQTFTVYKEAPLIDDVIFYNEFGNTINVDYKIYTLETEKYKEKETDWDKSIYTCKDVIGRNEGNGTQPTTIKECSLEIVYKDVEKTREIKVPYTLGTLKTTGEYKLLIEVNKEPSQKLDYVYKTNNVWLSEMAWWNANYQYRLTVNVTGGTGTLYNFPVYLNVPYNAHMETDFDDVRFIDNACSGSQTTELAYEVDKLVNSTSMGVWVKIPQLDAGIDNICMYYGNAAASNGENKPGVWSNNYTWVAHMNNDLIDSLGMGNITSYVGSPVYKTSNCAFGNCYQFPGGSNTASFQFYSPNTWTNPVYAEFFGNTSTNAAEIGLTSAVANNSWTSPYISFIVYYDGAKMIGERNLNGVHTPGAPANANLAYLKASTQDYFSYGRNATTSIMYGQNKTSSKVDSGNANILYYGAMTYIASRPASAASVWNGQLDEMRISSILRDSDWANRTIDNKLTSYYGFGIEEANDLRVLDAVQNSPLDTTGTTDTIINFSCNFTGSLYNNITSVSIRVYDSLNNLDFSSTDTGTYSVSFNTSWVTPSLAEDVYKWSCSGFGDGGTNDTSDNRTLTIHISAPVLTLYSPINNITSLNITKNVTLNYTVTDPYLSNCWFNTSENSTINIFTCNTTRGIIFNSVGRKYIYYYANDTFGNQNSSVASIYLHFVQPLISYTNSTELENTTIYFNITADEIYQSNATLIYNNTQYPMFINTSNLTFVSYSRDVTAPSVEENTQINISINYYIDEQALNTSNYTSIVYNVTGLNVSAGCTPASMTFRLIDEKTLGSVIGEYEYNFYIGLSNSSLYRLYGKITDTNNFSICVNTSISPTWTIGSGEIFYRNTSDYVDRRYYLFSGTKLNNVTNEINLYDLLSVDQTSFKLEVEDTSLSPYIDKFTSLIRWYPDLNEYKIVDMGKTDELGSTVIHVKTEDVDYRIGVYEQNGSLIKLADPMRMVCLVSPCTYTLKISPTDDDYTSFLGIQYSFTFNETTGIWNFVYSDPSQKTNTMNLTIWKDTSTSTFAVCSGTSTGYTGAISCNTSAYTGILRGEVRRVASPPITLVQKIVDRSTSAFKSGYGLWLSLLIAIPIMFLLVMISPIAAVLGGIIALIPALYLGSINIGIFGGFIILGGIVAHFLKRVS